jgi:hypothetical protein
VILCHIECREGVFLEEEDENLFIEEMEAALGTIFEMELSNVELIFSEMEPTGPIDVNDTQMWLIIDVDRDSISVEADGWTEFRALQRQAADAARKLLREQILAYQEAHTLTFSFRTWVRLLEGSFDQP